jgi:hypothetical protein
MTLFVPLIQKASDFDKNQNQSTLAKGCPLFYVLNLVFHYQLQLNKK